MGVYIKNMEMPKNCHSCPMCFMRFCQAGDRELSERETRPNAKRPEDCTLVPVPPHGRLGDLDELYASLKKWLIQNRHSMTEATRVWIRGVLEGIAAAPTIIPAEEGEAEEGE